MTSEPLRLLLDDASSASPHAPDALWHWLTPWLSASIQLDVYWLDRGQAPHAAGLHRIAFPRHALGACASDSLLIQQVCDQHRIDVFSSTGWTTPVSTPTLSLVTAHSLQPPPADLPRRVLRERELALCLAQHHLCATDDVREALLRQLPALHTEQTTVFGLDWSTVHADAIPQQGCDRLWAALSRMQRDARSGRWHTLFTQWKQLRTLQAAVDV
jgi:hypothetical protein